MIKSLYPTFQRWSDGGSVWVISDTHFGDDDCKLMSPDWPAPEEHIANINRAMKGGCSCLIHLGDVGNPKYMEQIKARHKVLITGNHDAGAERYKSYFDEIYTGPLMVSDKLILSHEPLDVLPWAFNLHGHIHSKTCPREYNIYGGWVGMNVAADVVDYMPVNLGELITKEGMLSDIEHIHHMTVRRAVEDDRRQANRILELLQCND